MKRSIAFAGLAALLIACGGEEARPQLYVGDTGGRAGAGGGAGTAGGAAVPVRDAGGGGESGDAGEAGAGADPGGQGGEGSGGGEGGGGGGLEVAACPSEQADAAPALDSDCDPEGSFDAGEVVSVAGVLDQLVAITPDELTVAWFSATGSSGVTLVADRNNPNVDFEEPQAVDQAAVTSISPDGLRLIALSPGQGALLELVRAARGAFFGEPQEGAFTEINADALERGLTLADAVVAPDDRTLYYSAFGSEPDPYPLRVSIRADEGPWPIGQRVELCEFRAYGALARRPTAVSADGLALFYYDAARDVSRVAFREGSDGPVVWSVDLPDRQGARPNDRCDRLYFARAGALIVADAVK